MNMKMQFGQHLLSLTILQIIPFSRFRRFLRIFCKNSLSSMISWQNRQADPLSAAIFKSL